MILNEEEINGIYLLVLQASNDYFRARIVEATELLLVYGRGTGADSILDF